MSAATRLAAAHRCRRVVVTAGWCRRLTTVESEIGTSERTCGVIHARLRHRPGL